MKTRITQLFGIQHPIILPGMSWVSIPELVAAVSNAGGLGILATGPLSTQQTKEAIEKIRQLTDKPFGCGITLAMPGAKENAKAVIDAKVPVVNVSLGKDPALFKQVHAYGGKVLATVVNEKHAQAAEQAGADAIMATGYEAAAHGGDVTSMVLIPALVDAVKVPVIAAGGIGDGRGLAAAIALGAEAAAMGTRFSASQESPIHRNTIDKILANSINDSIYSKRFDGIYCRVMKTPAAEAAIRRGMNLPKAMRHSLSITRELRLSWVKVLGALLVKGPGLLKQMAHMAVAFHAIKAAIQDGDHEQGVHLVGQIQGLVHDIPSVDELMQRTLTQAEESLTRMHSLYHYRDNNNPPSVKAVS